MGRELEPEPPAPYRYAIGAGLGLIVGAIVGAMVHRPVAAIVIGVAVGLAAAYILSVLREGAGRS